MVRRVASVVFLPPTLGRNLPDVAYVSGEMALTRHASKLLIEVPMMRSICSWQCSVDAPVHWFVALSRPPFFLFPVVLVGSRHKRKESITKYLSSALRFSLVFAGLSFFNRIVVSTLPRPAALPHCVRRSLAGSSWQERTQRELKETTHTSSDWECWHSRFRTTERFFG
jgi:hypothetical protein